MWNVYLTKNPEAGVLCSMYSVVGLELETAKLERRKSGSHQKCTHVGRAAAERLKVSARDEKKAPSSGWFEP